MSNNLDTLDVGQANELKLALRRTGWSNEEIKQICNGDILADFHNVVLGRSEIKPKEQAWTEKDNVIRFSVTSDGTTGKDWIKRLEKKGFRISDYAKSILKSSDFKPTIPGVTTEIAVLKGNLFSDSNRTTRVIRSEAEKKGFTTPNAEIACLIREKFSDEDIERMDLAWIVAMHEPIKDSDGDPDLLRANRVDDGHWLSADWGNPDRGWDESYGFAFALSHIGA